MAHPLVAQLRFTRSEWVRALDGVSAEDASRHFGPMNCISWIVGHLAWQEQLYWLQRAQGKTLVAEVEQCANGAPQVTPPLEVMWQAWRTITAAADPYLDALTADGLTARFVINGQPARDDIGTSLLRMTYHYWYHLGESQAIRQLLGHSDLPGFVGRGISSVPYADHA